MNPTELPATGTDTPVAVPHALSPTGDALAGGGELGSRIRELDWSLTALGPVEAWPQSLRTSVSIVLASRFPLSIWWGPEYVLLYNDAYAPLLGAKHPAALGRPAPEVWAEIMNIIGPMLAHVTTTGEATYTEDGFLPVARYGRLEESYFTWSHSPIRIESGGVGGVLTVVTETTQQVLGERRRRLLRDLAIATSGAKQVDEACRMALGALLPSVVPFALFYLLDDDGVRARLTATFEIEAGQPASPVFIELSPASPVWPLASAQIGTLHRVEDLEARFGALPSASWSVPPREAIVLAIPRPDASRPFGFLVAGLHAGHAMDESYRSFFDILGNQLSLALIHARAFAESEARASALAELDRAKIAFFSNISHEFRTPLTLLLGPVDDALQDTDHPLNSVQRERLEIARRNAVRLLRLVNTLLDFSRLEAGRAQASYEPVDLGAVTGDLASNFRSAIERAGLELVLEAPEDPVTVFVDRDMWEKVVFNLLSNSLKFTFNGHIRLTVRRAGERVEIAVQDTGSGIPTAELAKVFTRFHRVQGVRARTHEGSGIGLAFVHEIVRLHGGTIEVTSAPDAGATFTISLLTGSAHLPASDVRAASSATAPTAAGAMPFVEEALRWLPEPQVTPSELEVVKPSPSPRRTGDRILIADDNADMRAYLKRILEDRWTIEVVTNGADALAAARRELPDLLLADVMMPVMNGLELVRALRADPAVSTLPVILLSARAGQEAYIQGLESGAEDYLVKPFDARELIARIALHLDLGRGRAHERAVRSQLHRRLMQLPAGILALSGPNHIIEMANPEHQKISGNRATPGRPLAEAMPELVGQPFMAELDCVYRTGVEVIGDEARAMIDHGADGILKEYFFDYSYQPTFAADGEVDGVLVCFVDVTSHVHARQRVELLVTRAAQDDQRKDEFLAMLAHELRNPLAALSTALEIINLREARDDLERRGRAICGRQITTLVRLVDDLLDVSRITRGRIELRAERTDLVGVVQTAVQTTRPQFERRHHTVGIHVGLGAFVLDADPTRLEQVFTNLLTNAAKYTDMPSQIDVQLTRDDDATGSWARIEVIDPGRGIAPEALGGIFDLFAQVDSGLARSQGGLGIGLTLVRSLVELHGGQIQARSDGLGRGTTMVVRLPLSSGPVAGLANPTTDPATQQPTTARRIVIVEDNEDASMMLRDLLEAVGHTVHVASDGVSGRDLILDVRPDIAFVDIGLPGFDGYEVARAVRLVASTQLQLVALTGYGDAESRARASDAGFDAHLTKPFAVDQLMMLIAATTAG